MLPVQLHLILNHFPVVLFIVGTLLAALTLWGALKKLRPFALALICLAGLTTVPAYLTGEPAEEAVEEMAWADRDIIHDHEESAEAALVLALITAASAGALLAWQTQLIKLPLKDSIKVQSLMFYVCLAVAIVTTAVMANAAHKGGLIRHEELRSN
jgi:uncharacterized membrane protein